MTLKQSIIHCLSIFFSAVLLTTAGTSLAFAQQTDTTLSAIPTVTLNLIRQPAQTIFERIEQQTGYTIYYNHSETDSLLLNVQCTNEIPEKALKQAFEGTPFQVSVYKNKYIFILKDKTITTQLPENYFSSQTHPTEIATELNLNVIEQKATSENKVYAIGDASNRDIPERVRLTGIMSDFKTGEPVIGATIFLENTALAAMTDAFGFYSLQLPGGRQRLMIRGFGLKDTQRQVMLYGDGKLDIELEEEVYSLHEVVVTAERIAGIKSTNLGIERLQVKNIKNIPTVFGETDVIRVVMMLPGVKAVGEASSGFNVRGGSTDQNLILFNNGTIYNPTHLFGFFSVFNPDLIRDMELYKSSIPAKFGGRISSVLDINGREGNKKEYNGSVSIGLLTSRITLEGPIGKKTSFIIGGRTTYSDWILGMLPDDSGYKDGQAGFYDLNMIVDHKFSEKDNLYLSGYYSHDRFRFTSDDHYGYTNMNVSAKWRHLFNNQFTSTTAIGYDHYDYNSTATDNPFTAYALLFGIDQAYAKFDFTSYATNKHTVDFGLGAILYELNPGKYLPEGVESLVNPDIMQKEKALETAIYVADQWNITPAFSINAGLRYSMYNAIGPRTYNTYDPIFLPQLTSVTEIKEAKSGDFFKTYQYPELRLSARYIFREDLSVKAGVNTLSQYIHKLSNTTIMSPTDTWKLSDANIKPQKGMQVAAGIYKNFSNNIIETSIEAYYKTMTDFLDYRSGALLSMNHTIETDVINTKGRAYGVELMVRKTQGKLNGWFSYSYSRAELRQDDKRVEQPVNLGNWYPAGYDKPHDLKVAANYKFTQRYSISLNGEYSTGRPITLPTSKYEYAGGEFIYYSERNQHRIPDFFRMDFSINIEPSHHLTLLTHSSISIGVYNITGRKNVYSVYYTAKDGVINGYQMAIFGAPIPYIAYNIKF
ncbi:MAG: TonB-dependent receptor [Tannerella sp.]|jgi:outer membrane cobalamin receptor|nr:TonB-dependent receptor [Tannerella sp.]